MSQLDLPQADLDATKDKILKDLRDTVRRALFQTTAECLGSPNLTILAALGVDAESTLLHIFLEETNLLLNQNTEGDNGG